MTLLGCTCLRDPPGQITGPFVNSNLHLSTATAQQQAEMLAPDTSTMSITQPQGQNLAMSGTWVRLESLEAGIHES
jgi:hypothetical protein